MGAGTDIQIPPHLRKKYASKWWRINNLYWIINQHGKRVPFKCNYAQKKFYKELWYWNILLKARQWGGTTFISIFILDDCLFLDNLEAGIIAHNQVDATKIFRRKVKYPYENLPEFIRYQRPLVTDSRTELAFNNGSILSVATSFRSGTAQRLLISEYGKICAKYPDKAEEVRAGTLNAIHQGSMAFIESTAEGAFGDFYDRCQKARAMADTGAKLTQMDYKFHFVAWWMNPDYQLDPEHVLITDELRVYFDTLKHKHGIELTTAQKAWYAKKSADQGDRMKQEYPSTPDESFEKAIEGSYYATDMLRLRKNGQITGVPFEPKLPVNTAWDLGMSGSGGSNRTVIIFHQRYGKENRIIDWYQNDSLGLGHYTQYLQQQADSEGYTYGEHYLPHDIEVREFGSKDIAETRYTKLCRLMPGQKLVVVPQINDHADGLEAMHEFLPTCWIDERKCAQVIKALDAYRRVWDEQLAAFKPTPLHDWASDIESAVRQLACGYRDKPTRRNKQRRHRSAMAA